MVPGFSSAPLGSVTLMTASTSFESGLVFVEVAVTFRVSPTTTRSGSWVVSVPIRSTLTSVSISPAAGSFGSTSVFPSLPGSMGSVGSSGSVPPSPTNTMSSPGVRGCGLVTSSPGCVSGLPKPPSPEGVVSMVGVLPLSGRSPVPSATVAWKRTEVDWPP